ncbi:cupin domain-containing protein [Acidobacteria bacterium AH-259-L09]|nr:cupin domain-containing protein [Acidobacteria bacterium AH-259-L09]
MKPINAVVGMVVLLSLAALLLFCSSMEEPTREQTEGEKPAGFVLQPNEGEVLLLRRPGGGRVTIKVDPVNTGSMRVAMGTQQMEVGYRIPVHQHEHQDEILFVHNGHGIAILDDERVTLEPGTTVYIPEGVWHGVDNTGDQRAEIIWVVAPPGLERFFRDAGAPPGTQLPPLTAAEMEEIGRKHGVTVRIQ